MSLNIPIPSSRLLSTNSPKPSSLSSDLNKSVTSPGAFLSSGLTTLTQSFTTPSLSSLALSLTSLTPLTLPSSANGGVSDLTSLLGTTTGLSISLDSASASLGSLITSFSAPTLGSSVTLSLETKLSVSGLPGVTSIAGSAASETSSSNLQGSITLSLTSPGLSLTLTGTGLPDPLSPLTSSTTTPLAIPTASVAALLSCPADDGLDYLSPGGKAFQIECNAERRGYDILSAPVPNLQSCVDSCDAILECQAITYTPSNGLCTYKADTGPRFDDNNRMSAASIDLSCPGADGSVYLDHTGSLYQVMCDYSFPEGTEITSAPGSDYADCSNTCSELPGCTASSYSYRTCSFIQSYGDTSRGARRSGTNTVVLLSKRAVVIGPDGNPVTTTSSAGTVPPYTLSRSLMPKTATRGTSLLTAATSITSIDIPDIVTSATISLSSATISPGDMLSDPSSVLSPSTHPPSISVPTSLVDIASLTSTIDIDDTFSIISIDLGITTLSPSISAISTPGLSISTPDISLSEPSLPVTETLPYLISIATPIFSLSSASIPTSQLPTQTPVAYTCPETDGRIIVQNGLSYVVNCSSTTTGSSYSSKAASSSFNDCFRECDQSSSPSGPGYCTAFTYEGAANGAGPGTCYLYNGVGQGFSPPPNGRNTITAIRAVNYIPTVIGDAVSSIVSDAGEAASSLLSGADSIVSTILSPLPTILDPSNLPSASLSIDLPSISIPPHDLSSISISVPLPPFPTQPSPSENDLTASPLITLPPASTPTAAATCENGGNILNGCILVTITADPGVGAGVGIGLTDPSGSTILSAGLSATLGLSVSAGLDLGLGVGLGSSGLSIGLEPSLGLGLGVAADLGLSGAVGGLKLGGGGGRASTTSSRAAVGRASTTTVFTTSTITSCMSAGGTLTCPIGGMFTVLPSTSGAVTSVSVSVSVSVSYVTVTVASTSTPAIALPSLPLPLPLSPSVTTFSTRTSSSSSHSSSSSVSTERRVCRLLNVAGACILY